MWANTYLDILSKEEHMQDWMNNNKSHLRRALCQRVKEEIIEDHQKRQLKEDLPSEDDLVTVSGLLKLRQIISSTFLSASTTGSTTKKSSLPFHQN
jgi:hypothetical protein